MRALITGGAGFIASHIVDCLLAVGHEVAVLDDLSGGYRENVNPYARFYQASITDAEAVEAVFQECHFDYVYHLAAYAAEGLSHYIRRYNYTNNLIGSVNLINAAVRHNIKCFVFASSIAVYGAGSPPFTEEMTPHPEDPYGIAKYAVELDLAAAHRQFGLNYVIFRPHNVYGERQNIADPYRNVVGIFMRQILRHEPLTIFGDGEQRRAFTYIDDIVFPIAGSVFEPRVHNQTFDVGNHVDHSVNFLAAQVQTALGVRDYPILYLPERNEVKHAYSSGDKIAQFFGASMTQLPDGLVRMARWVRQQDPRPTKAFTEIELERGLPESWRSLVRI